MAKNVEYEELSTASISDKRNIVISEYSKGGYTLGQQVVVEEGSKKINMFVKNSTKYFCNFFEKKFYQIVT